MLRTLGRGDVAVLAFLCHGQKLLDLDSAVEEPTGKFYIWTPATRAHGPLSASPIGNGKRRLEAA